MTKKNYRPNVAIVVLNPDGYMLVCRRIDLPDVWQIPQGGVDDGEDVAEAMRRELREEVGITTFTSIGELKEPIYYDWPQEFHRNGFTGQMQYYFLVQVADDSEISLTPEDAEQEFSEWEWVSVTEFLGRLTGFKKAPYMRAMELLRSKYSDCFASR